MFMLNVVRMPAGARHFSRPTLGIPSAGVQRSGREASHSPPSSAEVKNEWSYTSAPPVCLHGVYGASVFYIPEVTWERNKSRERREIAKRPALIHVKQRNEAHQDIIRDKGRCCKRL